MTIYSSNRAGSADSMTDLAHGVLSVFFFSFWLFALVPISLNLWFAITFRLLALNPGTPGQGDKKGIIPGLPRARSNGIA